MLSYTLVLCSLVGVSTSTVNYTTVFIHGEGGFPCIRIPSITQCGGLLHAFAECRTRTGDGCIPTATQRALGVPSISVEAGVCYKNSSDDGATWSPLWWIEAGGINPTVLCEEKTSSLILQYNIGTTNWQTTSPDLGKSWTKPTSVPLGKYEWAYVGPGKGLQLSEKSMYPGRILFIGYHGSYEYAIVWYSDDGGSTYQLSDTPLLHMAESQLVELSDGSVMANMRNNHYNATCDCRAVAVSSDGGKSFGNTTYDPELISPVCMATIMSTENGTLLFADPASKTDREHGMVKRSDDSGKTWPYSWLVTEEDYAYSCLTHVASPEQVGLLWETGAANCTGPSCQLVFSKITVF